MKKSVVKSAMNTSARRLADEIINTLEIISPNEINIKNYELSKFIKNTLIKN